MIIREVEADERAAVGELRVAAYRALGLLSDGYAETLRGFGFGGDCLILVAAGEDGRVAGTITFEPFGPHTELARDDTEADIRAFAVDTDAQGQGIGRALLAAVIEHAGRNGLRRLRLCTQPEMKSAQRLYAAAGFTRTPGLDFEPAPRADPARLRAGAVARQLRGDATAPGLAPATALAAGLSWCPRRCRPRGWPRAGRRGRHARRGGGRHRTGRRW